MRFIDRDEVRARLTYDLCIPIVRDAMIAFSTGETRQLLRGIIPLQGDRLFGVMPGARRTVRGQADQHRPGKLRQGTLVAPGDRGALRPR
ncbi:hypothetical protein [Caulobacter sp. NIBR1757]|uniref:hypothetical protein n=1 Tax=Caulobacter sp. NIBR1757 TaxID=3016000 RepID=UPI0022F00188|nr:hypothetical protein [Caulobacter sp. NIBR1757]WGM39907.1 hypothetical protein AMEJIAPC_02847 [Caulobacter sp. NIBR1757]